MLMRRRQLIELNTSVLSPLLIENSYKFTLYFISWSILASNYQSDQHLWIFLHTCYYRSLPFSSSWPLLYQATPTCHRKSTCTPNCRTLGCQTQSEISLSPSGLSMCPTKHHSCQNILAYKFFTYSCCVLCFLGQPEDNTVGTPVDAAAGKGNATIEGHDVGAGIGGGGHRSTNVDVGHGTPATWGSQSPSGCTLALTLSTTATPHLPPPTSSSTARRWFSSSEK